MFILYQMAWLRPPLPLQSLDREAEMQRIMGYAEAEASSFTKCSRLYTTMKFFLVEQLDLGLYGEAAYSFQNCMSESA